MPISERRVPGRDHCMCKRPEVTACLFCFKNIVTSWRVVKMGRVMWWGVEWERKAVRLGGI